MRSLFRDIYDSLRNPEFWALSTWLDIVVRYRQSRLGILWLLAPPSHLCMGVGLFFRDDARAGILRSSLHTLGVGYAIFRADQ